MNPLRFLKSLFGGKKQSPGRARKRLDVQARFEILRHGVAGTMSQFYVARDRQRGEIVGLKICDPQKTAAFEARFKGLNKPSEGEISMMFYHPYIVQTYEYGLTTENAPYLVMEYLPGGPLHAHIVAQSAFLDQMMLTYIRQGAEALAVVHEAGFIHRDVCPRNFMFTRDYRVMKLTDFGLTVPATPPFMQPGNRTGTPNYMAPELVRRYKTDQRLDVFAFGVSMYEMLAEGELPWERGTTGMAALSHDQPPVDIRRRRPQINTELAEAIHWCIEPELPNRCPNMRAFLDRIAHLQSHDG
ncbi:MAG: serine/threonine protein kinase [Planctomycetota bacterium]|nr:MAG: serine/threonine protein kinase [Planctomycetota bacterium]